MDFLSVAAALYIGYVVGSVITLFFLDSDFGTAIAEKFGTSPEKKFNQKVVWITGASSGIGEGIAKELAKCNARLVLSARRKDELERVKKLCLGVNSKMTDEDVLIVPFDVTDYSAHQPSFDKVLQHFGKLDVLVSNAGRSQRAQWQDIQLEVDKQMFDLNVFSVVNLNRIAVRHFLKVGSGQLGIMSSLAGKIGAPCSGSYTGSKFALHGYFESLRNETRNVKLPITLICPGPVHSSVLGEAFTSNPGEKFGESHKPTDRRMTAERCGHLSLVAMANELEESWVALSPLIHVVYFMTHYPFVSSRLLRVLGGKNLFMKIRDNRNTVK